MKSMNYYTIYQQAAAAVILGQQLQWLGGCMYAVGWWTKTGARRQSAW